MWFGSLAAILVSILPGMQIVFLNSKSPIEPLPPRDALIAPTMFVLHFIIPVAAAAFFGRRFGATIIARSDGLKAKDAFLKGVKIALYSAIAWALGGLAWLIVMSMFTDVSRMYGGVLVLLLFGLPVYPCIGGVFGILLKLIAAFRRG